MIHSNRTGKNERAVSPVVGVMLMLVVVIIIAAMVSGFSGSLIGTSTKKAPTLNMDVKIVNTGDWRGSGFFATVTGVSEPIPTKDLKIVTSYNVIPTQNAQMLRGAPSRLTGGSTIVPGTSNINVLFNPGISLNGLYVAPFGTGPGVNGTEALGSDARSYSLPSQQFGNYSLMQGTTLSAQPAGGSADNISSSAQSNHYGGYGADNASYTIQSNVYTPPVYGTCYRDCYDHGGSTGYACDEVGCCKDGTPDYQCNPKGMCDYFEQHYGDTIETYRTEISSGGWSNTTPTVPASAAGAYHYTTNCPSTGSCIDPTRALLGNDWNYLQWGDSVNVKVIYTPTGSVIFNQDVPVTEQ